MKKRFLMPLLILFDKLNVWDERVEQIHMEVEHNPKIYPLCARRRREYREARHAFEDAHPEVRNDLDSVLSLYGSYLSDIAAEAYKQGAADLYNLLRQLEAKGNPPITETEDDL